MAEPDAAEILGAALVKVRAARAYAKGGMGEDSTRCHAEAVELVELALAILRPPAVIEVAEPLSGAEHAEIRARWRAQQHG